MNKATRLRAIGYKTIDKKCNTFYEDILFGIKNDNAVLFIERDNKRIKFDWRMNRFRREEIDSLRYTGHQGDKLLEFMSEQEYGWEHIGDVKIYEDYNLLGLKREAVRRGDYIIEKSNGDIFELNDWIYDIKRDVVYIITENTLRLCGLWHRQYEVEYGKDELGEYLKLTKDEEVNIVREFTTSTLLPRKMVVKGLEY